MRVLPDGNIEIEYDEEIGQAIIKLEDKFRGLWRLNELIDDDSFVTRWYVTFVYKGEYVETPACNTIYEAFNFALKKVGQDKNV